MMWRPFKQTSGCEESRPHKAYSRYRKSQYLYLVLSTLGALATVFTSLFYCFLSVVTSLSSASFISVTSCVSSIHFRIGRPFLLLPSPCASFIPFSNPSDRITCSKNPNFLLSAVCCCVSSSIPISMRTLSFRDVNRNPANQNSVCESKSGSADLASEIQIIIF